MDPTEQQLENRNAAAGGTPSTGGSNDALFSTLQNRMLETSGMISSSASNITNMINEVVTGQKTATEKSGLAIASSSNREIAFQKEQFAIKRESELSGMGGSVNSAALKQLDDRTEKSLKDLAQRRDELLLQNDAEGARAVSGLQLQAIQFRQQAEQAAFTNFFNMGQLAIQKTTQENVAAQFKQTMDFNKLQLQNTMDTQMASLASEWGVAIKPGDTIYSVASRVAPLASAKRKAEIASLLKDVNDQVSELSYNSMLSSFLLPSKDYPNGMSPELAVETVIQIRNQGGTKTTEAQRSALLQQARAEKLKIDTENAKETAKQEGKSLWRFFGGDDSFSNQPYFTPPTPKKDTNLDFSKADFSNIKSLKFDSQFGK